MFIRNLKVPIVLAMLVMVVAWPAATMAQDAAGIVEAVRQGIGKEMPNTMRLTAAGSGYTGSGDARRHFRIESYTQELDLGAPALSDRLVRIDRPDGAATPVTHTDTRAIKADSAWADQHALWMTPLGFLAGAASRSPTVATETLFGTPYTVVTFTAGDKQQVRGYVTDKHVLERVRTEVQDRARGRVQVESVFFDWRNFNGLKFPSIIIQKENDQVARILVIDKVEPGTPAGLTSQAK